MIVIENKRCKPETLYKKYGADAIIADVTSKAQDGLAKLSPFYPHGGIPVPNSEGYIATCVEAIWQGLKVFETADIDTEMFRNDTMPLGHRYGVGSQELLSYIDARKRIYIPTYRWVLENKVMHIIERLREAFIFLVDHSASMSNFTSLYGQDMTCAGRNFVLPEELQRNPFRTREVKKQVRIRGQLVEP